MIDAEVYCPLPCVGCPSIVDEECGQIKNVTWTTNSTEAVFFMLKI
jgi:hypothetical protein